MEAVMSQPSAAKEIVAGAVSSPERREASRFPCSARGNCQPVTATEAGNCWPVEAVNISVGGIGVLLSRRFEPGTLLALELSRESNESVYLPLARVCRATPNGPHWLLGCVWQGLLGTEDMQSLVGAADLWQATRKRVREALAVSRQALKIKCKAC